MKLYAIITSLIILFSIQESVAQNNYTYTYTEDQACDRDFCQYYHNVDKGVCAVTSPQWGIAQIVWDRSDRNDCKIDLVTSRTTLTCSRECDSRPDTSSPPILYFIGGGIIFIWALLEAFCWWKKKKRYDAALKEINNDADVAGAACGDVADVKGNNIFPIAAAETEPTATANVYDHSNSKPAAAAVTDEKDDDVEDQKDDTAAAASSFDNEAGKGIGIAIFVLLAVAFIAGLLEFTFSGLLFAPFVSLICLIAARIMASVITCGCCCASNYNLSPKVKRWSTAMMLCLVVQFVIIAIAIIMGVAEVGAVTTTVTSTSIVGNSTYTKTNITTTNPVVHAMLIIVQILSILPCVFAGIFTWGRNSCGNSNSA